MIPVTPILPSHITAGQSLAANGNVPILYPTLQATWFLESLTEDDIPRLEEAMQMLASWVGSALNWSWSSVHSEVEPFRVEDLEYISCYPTQVKNPHPQLDLTTDAGALLRHMDLMACDVFGYSAHGGALRNQASSTALHFFGEVLDGPHGDWFFNASCLQVFLPVTFPLNEFVAQVDALAIKLRIRWASAGLGLSHWEFDAHESTRQAIFEAARRYPGFDVPFFAGLAHQWQDAPRSANWRVYLNRELAAKVTGLDILNPRQVTVSQLEEVLVLQAGEVPMLGDLKNLEYPIGYATLDRLISPLRRREEFSFGHPWSARTTSEWMHRFHNTD